MTVEKLFLFLDGKISQKMRSTLPETDSSRHLKHWKLVQMSFSFWGKKGLQVRSVRQVEEFDPFWKGRTTKCVEQQNDVDIVYLRLFLGWSTFPKTNMLLEDDPASFWTRLPF